MKICPKCQQTYTDETLNFCLNDGSNLVQDAANDLPQTVMIQPPRQTNPGQGLGNQSAQTEQNQSFGSQSPQFGSPNQSQNSWNAPQQPQSFGQQPSSMIPPKQKSSKSWIWVLGILGGLIVLCGGGFGILVLIGLNTDEPRIQNSANNTSTSPTPKNLTKYDLSSWKTETDEFATTKYEKGVFTIETIRDDYYYVVVTKDLKTQDKITKVTVKNVDAKPVAGGFGLIVHSYATPLVGDYGFLIDSNKKRYRIVEHSVKSEKVLTNWKNSSAIKDGNSENIIEVRDEGKKIEFYINGEFVASVDDKYENKNGVAGFYASDGIPIEFSNLTTESK